MLKMTFPAITFNSLTEKNCVEIRKWLNVHNNGERMLGKLATNPSVSIRMANRSDTFGFELFSKLHHSEIQKKEDVIILFVHWYLVKYGLRCIGVGDSVSFDRYII